MKQNFFDRNGNFIERKIKLEPREIISLFLNLASAINPNIAIPIAASQMVLYTGVNLFDIVKHLNFSGGLKGNSNLSMEYLEKNILIKMTLMYFYL